MRTEQSPPTTLSEERLAELKELYSKATPGPWVADDNEGFSQWSVWERMTPTGHGKPGRHILDIVGDDGQEENDAALVVAIHNAFPSLLHAAEQMARAEAALQEIAGLFIGGADFAISAAHKAKEIAFKALPPAPENQKGGAA